MAKICGIYYIKNLINDKYYVGQSVDIRKRWHREKNELSNDKDAWNTHLQSAWKMYGEKNFEFCIIEKCDKDILNEREVFWIDKLAAFTNGYNMTSGGRLNMEVSEETLAKIREYWANEDHLNEARQRQINRWKNPEIRKRMSGENHHNYGKEMSQETRDKMSKARIGYTMSDEHKDKISKSLKKYFIDHPEVLTELSRKQKEYYEQHSDSLPVLKGDRSPNFGKKMSQETKNKMIESLIKHYEEHPEDRVKASEKLKQYNKEHPEFIDRKKIKVNQYSKDGQFVKTWSSASDASRELGICSGHISSCCVGKRKTAGGYCWRHASDVVSDTLEVAV